MHLLVQPVDKSSFALVPLQYFSPSDQQCSGEPNWGVARLWLQLHGPAAGVGVAVGELRPPTAGPLLPDDLSGLLPRR